MKTIYDNLRYSMLTDKQKEQMKTHYRVLVTNWSTSYTAFTTFDEFFHWLYERGLERKDKEASHGVIIGRFQTVCTMDKEEYRNAKQFAYSATLSNWDLTECKLVKDNGIVTVYTLNPNVERITMPYSLKDKIQSLYKLLN
jgi:hypothetical protein